MSIPQTEEMLATLVAEPSVSCTDPQRDQGNLGVVHHLAGWLEELGFQVQVLPLPHKPGKGNLIARIGGGGGGGLALAGHTDTVPCDESLWSADPFTLAARGSRLHGLGSCDMKGFFPIALAAAGRHANSRFKQPLTIVATADEETSMDGARHLVEQGLPKAAAAVIGEPTGLRPVRAHKGVAMLSIAVQGASGHSSNPALGDNALEAMHRIMGALLEFRDELGSRHADPRFEVRAPTLNLGCLRAGDNPNRICGHAELQIDLRLLPGMDTQQVLADLRGCVETASGATPATVETKFQPIAPYQTAADGRLVRLLESLSKQPSQTAAFGTEAPFFQSLGMETVVCGAGSIAQAHQPDEFVDGRQMQAMEDVLTALIAAYCL